ncbi:MAG: hypothetical protein Q7U14_04340 [Lacisediminimonas sp.]|nr:hypothetical protein [Lacisediminimonas sp.]
MNQLENAPQPPSSWRGPIGMALATAALIAGFYLLREHWSRGRDPQAPGRTNKE